MLSVSNEVKGDVNEVKVVGRLDAKSAREAEETFANISKAATNVVLDFSELEYIASAGLRVLKRLRGDVRANGGTLTLRGVQDDVMEVFEMTGFAAMLAFE